MADRIRILVADDHPVVRDGLVAILSTQPDFQIVGEAADGEELIRQAASLLPDIILLDLEMPGKDGVEALQQVRSGNPEINAVVFTAYDTDERILGAVRAGVKGYLLKGAARDEIFNAIRVVHTGGSLLQPVVANRLLEHLRALTDERLSPLPGLTERETEVLRLMAQGKFNKEIAETLVISIRTVKFHVSSILRKLDAGNRTEAVRKAVEQGLLEL